MAAPDFIQLRCVNNDSPTCVNCGRDFIIPVSAITGIYKVSDGKAEVLFKFTEFNVDPNCFNAPMKYRFIKTTADWNSVVLLLDGKVADFGNCNMVQENF